MISALFSQYIQVFGRTGLLCLYLVLHLCVGLALPYRRGTKPCFFMLMEYIGLDLERRLNRESRSQSARLMRGVVVMLVLGAFVVFAGYMGQRLGWMAELVLLAVCVNAMAPLKVTRRLAGQLQRNELQAAVESLQPYLTSPLDAKDAHAVIRKGIEFIVISVMQFLVAPVFWFWVAGSTGLLLYTAYAALNQAFGLQDERRKYFGWGVRKMDMLLNIVPAFLTALLLCVSALFVSKSNPLRAFLTLFGQAGRSYLTWPMAAMAGGLGVTLGGSVRYSADYTVEQAWIGPKGSTARLEVTDLERAVLLQYVLFVCGMGFLSFLMITAL